MKKLLSLFFALSLLASILRANDCVPLTFTTLSMLANTPVSYETWCQELIKNNKPPHLIDCIHSWQNHFMVTPLVCVFSNLPAVKETEREVAYDNTPYLWIGRVPKQITDNAPADECHAAIAVFKPEKVWLFHTISNKAGGVYYYVEKLDYKEFLERTYLIYEAVSVQPIKWKNVFNVVFTNE